MPPRKARIAKSEEEVEDAQQATEVKPERPKRKRAEESAPPTNPTKAQKAKSSARAATEVGNKGKTSGMNNVSETSTTSYERDNTPLNWPIVEKKVKKFLSPLDFLTPSPWRLPTTNNAISNFDPNIIARDALETNVIMHPRLPALISSFLDYKLKNGSAVEKALYADMSQHDLVARLMVKRCLHFVQSHDYTVLRNGVSARRFDFHADEEWLWVGTENEHRNNHVKMEEYLTYDEMMVASLLGSSGPTYFINIGDRGNCARVDPYIAHQDRGIIVGLVGARFARLGQMDHALMFPPIEHTTSFKLRQQDPGVTRLFQEFFGGKATGAKFNLPVYRARMRLTIETLLLEADDRAAQASTTAYVHLVGLGLGVWAVKRDVQSAHYVQVVIECLQDLHLKHVSTLELAWISVPPNIRQECEHAGKEAGIRVLFNKRPPCTKLDTDELLVRSWAWDSNTLPGNEYWSNILDDSDDPAATCCSTVAELHNPYVNPFAHRIKVLQDRRKLS